MRTAPLSEGMVMMKTTTLLTLAAGLLLSASASAQMPPTPKPGPEQEVLAKDAGTWDASVEMMMPGAQAMTSKGTEVSTMGCGGMCLITDFSSELMPGVPFKGHGLTAYDSTKKKYVGSWSDSMAPGLQISEATYDPATKSTTAWMEGPDMTGTIVKTKSVSNYVDADHRTMTMFMTGADGKEAPTMKITYTRRK
jgi:uncharacterized protein DUF1579